MVQLSYVPWLFCGYTAIALVNKERGVTLQAMLLQEAVSRCTIVECIVEVKQKNLHLLKWKKKPEAFSVLKVHHTLT